MWGERELVTSANSEYSGEYSMLVYNMKNYRQISSEYNQELCNVDKVVYFVNVELKC